MMLTLEAACALLREQDDVLILCHKSPDGDTIGSACALWEALSALGKKARIECADEIPAKYGYIWPRQMAEFEPSFTVTVDVADPKLLGREAAVDLAIDHHGSHREFAADTLLCARAAAAETVAAVIDCLGVKWTKTMAEAVYTGVSTDTGCFRYSNTTADSLRLAARMMEYGADTPPINFAMFEQISRKRVAIEREIMGSVEYFCGGRCAVICLTKDLTDRTGATQDDLDDISAFPRRIEGVAAGVTIREEDAECRISVRSSAEFDAAALCAEFGGGGHLRAAGCRIPGGAEQAKREIVAAVTRQLERSDGQKRNSADR